MLERLSKPDKVTLRYIMNVLIKKDMYSNEEEAISSKRLPGKEDVMLWKAEMGGSTKTHTKEEAIAR